MTGKSNSMKNNKNSFMKNKNMTNFDKNMKNSINIKSIIKYENNILLFILIFNMNMMLRSMFTTGPSTCAS